MRSIRGQLAVGLIGRILLLIVVGGAGLFLFVRRALLRQFDMELRADARAVMTAVSIEENGKLVYEPSEPLSATFSRHAKERQSYFQIWGEDGTAVVASESLGTGNLPSPVSRTATRSERLTLPNGRAGRAIRLRFTPRSEVDNANGDPSTRLASTARPLILMVAEESSAIDRTIGVLGSSLVLSTLAIAAGSFLIIWLNLRSALRPLGEVADKAAQMRPSDLSARFAVDPLPDELRPVCLRLNDLLSRLEEAFARERRLTADIAHELRSRITEVRTAAEVGLKWPDSLAPQQLLRDIFDAAGQMERTVSSQLTLARWESGREALQVEEVRVAQVISSAWKPLSSLSNDKGLKVRMSVQEELVVRTDPQLLQAIARNLLENAVHYTPRAGSISCSAVQVNGHVAMTFENDDQTLAEADLRKMFEPFWRKDEARSDASHGGLGLALVASYARAIGATINATKTAEGIQMKILVPVN